MPYVTESYSAPDVRLAAYRPDDQLAYVTSHPLGISKWQRGYRSGPLSPAERAGIARGTNRASMGKYIPLLDDEYQQVGGGRPRQFRVNERDYEETHPGYFTFSGEYGHRHEATGTTTIFSPRGFAGLTRADIPWPSVGSDAQLAGYAGELMRAAAPTKPAFDLVRSLGELKDAHLMFRAANYLPNTARRLGGSYLNLIFGVIPTYEDVMRFAETVWNSDIILSDYVRQERMRFRRNRRRTLYESSDYTEFSSLQYAPQGAHYSGFSFLGVQGVFAGNRPGSGSSWADVSARWGLRVNVESSVKGFGTWEYFIPRPEGLLGRLNFYSRQAATLMGGGLNASNAWQLTPWTWLSDWFVDVGGLLRYQQSVADNQLVASNLGWTRTDHLTAELTLYSVTTTGQLVSGYRNSTISSPCGSCKLEKRRLKRRPGNPFAMASSWDDLTASQWSILAALGISRGGIG